MSLKDRELDDYYSGYFDLFSRDGWKVFEEEFKDSLETLKVQLETSVEPETSRLQGQIKELKILCGFKDFIVASYEQLKEDEKEGNSN